MDILKRIGNQKLWMITVSYDKKGQPIKNEIFKLIVKQNDHSMWNSWIYKKNEKWKLKYWQKESSIYRKGCIHTNSLLYKEKLAPKVKELVFSFV